MGRALAVPTGCFIQVKHQILQKHLCTIGFMYLGWPDLLFHFACSGLARGSANLHCQVAESRQAAVVKHSPWRFRQQGPQD